MLYIITIHFIINQSYLYYYLLVCFLLGSYWTVLITIFDSVLSLYIYFIHNLNYDIFSESLIVNPIHTVSASSSSHPNCATSLAPSFIVFFWKFYIMSTYRISAITPFDWKFHWCYFVLTYYSVFFSAQWLFFTSAIVNCCCFCFSYLSITWWLWTIVWSTITSEVCFRNIIKFYFPEAMLYYHCHHGLLLLFLYSIVVTSRMSVTKCFDSWFHW